VPELPGPSPFDAANELLAEVPANLMLSMIQTPPGQRMTLTIRTATTTLTVVLTKEKAAEWGQLISGQAGLMTGSGLFVAGPGHGNLANGNGHG
jgi:hypothetical protein